MRFTDSQSGSMRWRQRVNVSFALLAALLVGVAAIAATADGADGRKQGQGTTTLRVDRDWPSLDPYVDAGFTGGWAVVAPGYDRLISIGPKGAAAPYVPYLATSWVQKAKSIVFRLRRDARCTDGHALTPVDVLNSVKRFIEVPKRNGSLQSTGIGGTFGQGPVHLRASNKAGTFTLSVEKPFRGLLATFSYLPIICPAGLAAARTDPRALEGAIYGSGPYQLVSATHGDRIVYKLRSGWTWGPPGTTTKTMPETLVYRVVTDETAAANLLLVGDLDYATVSGPDVSRLLASQSLKHTALPNYQAQTVVFKMREGGIFADPGGAKLREAIFAAIDPQAWNRAAFSGRGTVSPSVIRPGGDCFDPKTRTLVPKPSVERAKQILAADGWRLQDGKLTKAGRTAQITLLMSPLMNSGPDYIFGVLNELGFDVDFRNLSGAGYGTAVLGSNFDITVFRATRFQREGDQNLNVLTGFPPPAGSNYGFTGYQDAELRRWVNAAFQNPGKGGCKYFSLVQQRMLQRHYVVPLAAANFDFFGRKGTTFPPATTDGFPMPVYYIKTA
jgi:peptide/nickel transport system substrate-binding protein